MDRRAFLGAAALATLSGCGLAEASPPLALVYRGPAACDGCAESVAALLRGCGLGLRVEFCGPRERTPITPETLRPATIYAQPGGGDDVAAAWRQVRRYADPIRSWLHAGGHYLGFCMGGYLAGRDPGFDLLPGDTAGYIDLPNTDVHTGQDTVVKVSWRGAERYMFFQDGPYFALREKVSAHVLSTYTNGAVAAVVTRYGAGRVGVVGPHPEADASWYPDGLHNPDGINFDLGYDLIRSTLRP